MSSRASKTYSVWWPQGAAGRFVRYTNARIVTAECTCREDLPEAPSELRDAYDAHVKRGEANLVHVLFADSGEEGVCPLEWFGRDLRRKYRVTEGVYIVKYELEGEAAHKWRSLVHPEWLTKKDVAGAERMEPEGTEEPLKKNDMVECRNKETCIFGRFFPREKASPWSPERDDFSDWTCPECIVLPLAVAMEEWP